MTEPRKLRVFLCHASQDKPVVRELYQRLLAEGWIDPWLDEERLLPGQDWDMEIEKAVEAADVIVVCISNTSVNKEGYVQKEIRSALNLALYKPEETIFIVPVRLNDCLLPRNLRLIQYIDYFPKQQKIRAYDRLRQSLKNRYEQQIKLLNKEDGKKKQTKSNIQMKRNRKIELPNNESSSKQFDRQNSNKQKDIPPIQEKVRRVVIGLEAWRKSFRRGDLFFAIPLISYLILKGVFYITGVYITYLEGYLPFIAGLILLIKRESLSDFATRLFLFLFLFLFSLIHLGAVVNSSFLLSSFFFTVFGIVSLGAGVFMVMRIYTVRPAPFFAITFSLFISLESYINFWGRLITGNYYSTELFLILIGVISAILLIIKK